MSKKLINIGIKAKKASKIKVDKKNKNKVLKKYLQLINNEIKQMSYKTIFYLLRINNQSGQT